MTSSKSKEEETPLSESYLRSKFDTLLGPQNFHTGWSTLLALDPAFFSASLNLSAVPITKSYLSPKNQALIALSVDSASTHLYTPGIRAHIASALSAGASLDEILEVIELTSTLGIHACNIGVPLLVEVLRENGGYDELLLTSGENGFDREREDLKKEFTEKRGYWHEFWEDFLRLDKEFFKAYLDFSSVPWTTKDVDGSSRKGKGVLEPKMKELVYCAFDAASTHLYVPGLKLHMKNALGCGATPQEILEVLEIATLLSLHTAHVAMPIVAELVGKTDSKTGSSGSDRGE